MRFPSDTLYLLTVLNSSRILKASGHGARSTLASEHDDDEHEQRIVLHSIFNEIYVDMETRAKH